MPVLRDIYLCAVFLWGAGATLAPYFGITDVPLTYQTARGTPVDLPKSVIPYAVLLLIAVAGFVLRVIARPVAAQPVAAGGSHAGD